MNVQNYVTEYLKGASPQFLQEIVDHGIYNTGADVSQGETDAEYEAIASEFELQARSLLGS